jgi:hypothetical protein
MNKSLSLTCICREAVSPTSQLQMYGKTRFQYFAVLLRSLAHHHDALHNSVTSPSYAHIAAKALKKGIYIPEDDDANPHLAAAEMSMQGAEVGLYNTRAPPAPLLGLGKYTVIFLDITSQRFWDACQVCAATAYTWHPGLMTMPLCCR